MKKKKEIEGHFYPTNKSQWSDWLIAVNDLSDKNLHRCSDLFENFKK